MKNFVNLKLYALRKIKYKDTSTKMYTPILILFNQQYGP